MNTVEIISKAATTGKADSSIGLVTSNGEGIRRTWKLNGKRIAFKNLMNKLNKGV